MKWYWNSEWSLFKIDVLWYKLGENWIKININHEKQIACGDDGGFIYTPSADAATKGLFQPQGLSFHKQK